MTAPTATSADPATAPMPHPRRHAARSPTGAVLRRLAVAMGWAVTVAGPGVAETIPTTAGPVRVDAVVQGLDTPWAIGLLPGGGLLVTEREGDLIHVADGRSQRVSGTPQVWANGQGGLLDVTVARDFAQSREIFLTYAKP